jgi:predicted protein tyrosine phosphatase
VIERVAGFEVLVSALHEGRLAIDAQRFRPTHLVSLLDPWLDGIDLELEPRPEHLVLRFWDSLDGTNPEGFACSQLDQLLAFLRDALALALTSPVRLLVHCHQGHSRSPAVAYLGLALWNGAGRERESFAELRRLVPNPMPNRLIIERADAALERSGALLAPLDEYLARFAIG